MYLWRMHQEDKVVDFRSVWAEHAMHIHSQRDRTAAPPVRPGGGAFAAVQTQIGGLLSPNVDQPGDFAAVYMAHRWSTPFVCKDDPLIVYRLDVEEDEHEVPVGLRFAFTLLSADAKSSHIIEHVNFLQRKFQRPLSYSTFLPFDRWTKDKDHVVRGFLCQLWLWHQHNQVLEFKPMALATHVQQQQQQYLARGRDGGAGGGGGMLVGLGPHAFSPPPATHISTSLTSSFSAAPPPLPASLPSAGPDGAAQSSTAAQATGLATSPPPVSSISSSTLLTTRSVSMVPSAPLVAPLVARTTPPSLTRRPNVDIIRDFEAVFGVHSWEVPFCEKSNPSIVYRLKRTQENSNTSSSSSNNEELQKQVQSLVRDKKKQKKQERKDKDSSSLANSLNGGGENDSSGSDAEDSGDQRNREGQSKAGVHLEFTLLPPLTHSSDVIKHVMLLRSAFSPHLTYETELAFDDWKNDTVRVILCLAS